MNPIKIMTQINHNRVSHKRSKSFEKASMRNLRYIIDKKRTEKYPEDRISGDLHLVKEL